jgi:hypothetical protein
MSKEPLHVSPLLRDIFCQAMTDNGNIVATVGGDVYIKCKPVRHFIMTDLDGLFRLQREVAEAIESIARGKKLEQVFPVQNS